MAKNIHAKLWKCLLTYLCLKRTVAASSSGCQSKSELPVASTLSDINNEQEELKRALVCMLIESRNICLHSTRRMSSMCVDDRWKRYER